jgi:uncharacterized protein (TIGR02246 family)
MVDRQVLPIFLSTTFAAACDMRRSLLAAALAFVVLHPSAAAAQTTFRVDQKALEAADGELAALRLEYAAAANAGDAARLSRLYASDAIAVWNDGVLLRGPAEIQRYSSDALSSVPSGASVTLTPTRFKADERMASETGTFAEAPSANDQPTATGVYVAIYTRGADGVWRISMEVRSRGRDKQVVRW